MVIITINIVWRIWTAVYLKENLNEHHAEDQWVAMSIIYKHIVNNFSWPTNHPGEAGTCLNGEVCLGIYVLAIHNSLGII